MRAALDRIDVIGKREQVLGVAVVILERDLHLDLVFLARKIHDFLVKRVLISIQKLDKRLCPAGKFKRILFAGPFIFYVYLEAFIQKRQFAQAIGERIETILQFPREYLFIRLKRDARSRRFRFADDGDFRDRLTALIPLMIDLPVTPDFDFKPFRQSVHDGNAHTVKASGDLITLMVKFSSGVKFCQDDLYRGFLLGLMHIDRYAAAVIYDRNAVILMYDDLYILAIAGHRLVNRIIYDLIDEMVESAYRGIADIHRRTFPDRLQPLQDLDRLCVIFLSLWHIL